MTVEAMAVEWIDRR